LPGASLARSRSIRSFWIAHFGTLVACITADQNGTAGILPAQNITRKRPSQESTMTSHTAPDRKVKYLKNPPTEGAQGKKKKAPKHGLKHVLKTGLPPGIDPIDLKDPGANDPGKKTNSRR
jgi:hypothetical protein